MADATDTPLDAQHDIELPNGVIASGIGGDPELIQDAIEAAHEEVTPDPEPQPAVPVAAAPVVEQPKTRGQKRFDALTAERENERRRADAAEAKLKELEAKASAPAPVAQPAPVVAQPVAEPVAAPTRPKPLESEVGTKYAQYADFIEDLADWKADQRIAAERAKLLTDLDARTTARIEADRASRTRQSFVENILLKEGPAAYDDFDAVLKASTKIVPYAVQDAILKLPNPEHAIYALAKDETQVDRLIPFLNDPMRLGIEVAQFIPRVGAASPASTPAVVRTTNAAPPIQPVGASSRTTTPSIAEVADKGDYAAYKALRDAQRKAAR